MTVSMWKGNTLPVLNGSITSGGAAVDLTGSTVTFSMRGLNSSVKIISAASASILSAPAGTVSYAWVANDVNQVGTFNGWWTVNLLGKAQDTSEFPITITEHAPAQIAVPVPVNSDGSTTIYKGDAYLAAYGRALIYDLQAYDAPNLTGATVTFRVEGEFHTTATAVDADTISVDLTSVQTTIPAGTYRFQLESLLTTGATATLLRSMLTVVDSIVSP